VVGEDLGAPAPDGLGEGGKFGSGRGAVVAPVQQLVDDSGGFGGVVGPVDVTDLLLRGPGIRDGVVRVSGGERVVESLPGLLVEAFRTEQQELADVIERVALPAPVLEGGPAGCVAGSGSLTTLTRISPDMLTEIPHP